MMAKTITFSKPYKKLSLDRFTTIRRYDKYREGIIYKIHIKPLKTHFYAKLIKKEKKKLKDIPTWFLLLDTECTSREKAIKLLNSFYKNKINEDEELTILYLEKIEGLPVEFN